MERKAIREALTSPYGTFEWFDNFGLFTPTKEVTPVLLHVDYQWVEPEVVEALNERLQQKAPPIILFTYGDQPANVAGLFNQWKDEEFTVNTNVCIALVKPKVGYDGGYATLHDNLNQDFESLLNVLWGDGKIVGMGSRIAEAFSSIFNKPAVTMNVVLATEMRRLLSILHLIPAYEFSYTERISTPFIRDDKVCSCCGKNRGPLKFFYHIQSSICGVCEKRIRKIGKVDLNNWVKAALEVQSERARTRQANNIKLMRQAGFYRCIVPGCNDILTYVVDNKYHCPKCGREYFARGNRLYEVRTITELGKQYVYEYSLRNTGHAVFKYATPLAADSSPVANCEFCTKLTTHWEWFRDADGSTHRLCRNCAQTINHVKH